MEKGTMITEKCFMCGKNNPIGIKMEIKSENGEAKSIVNLNENYEGYNGTIHGGIVTALLDEIAVYAAFSLQDICVTYEINVRFKKPVKSNNDYFVYGYVLERKGKIILCKSKIIDNENNIYAEADVKLFKIQ